MPAGLEVRNNDYQYVITDTGRSLAYKNGTRLSLPGGYSRNTTYAEYGAYGDIPQSMWGPLVAYQPSTWVHINTYRWYQPTGAPKGDLRFFNFDMDGVALVYPGNVGLQVFDAQENMQFNSAWGFLKILHIQEFSTTWEGSWTYSAPSGKKIAAITTPGYSSSEEGGYDGYWYAMCFRIINDNTRFECALQELAWWYSDYSYFDRFKEPFTVIIVDVTDFMDWS